MCACVRVCVCAAKLFVVGLEMHHTRVICCGVGNGSSPGLSHLVETRLCQSALELALQANKSIHFM